MKRIVIRVVLAFVPALLIVSAAVVVQGNNGLQPQSTSAKNSASSATGYATWHERYASVEDAVRAADEVVLAVVTGSKPGRVISAGGVDLPFTDVQLRTTTAIGGTLRPGDLFVIELTGGQSSRGPIVIHDDPPYTTTATYFLLLRKTDQGYRTVSPVGRFLILGGLLRNVSDTGVGQHWNGRTPAAALEGARRIRIQ